MQKNIIQSKTSCWVITEGMAGTENQCLGITDQLGITPIIKHVKLRFPWKQLSPYLRIGQKWAFSSKSDSFDAPFPDLVIASGRKSIPASLYIKKASEGKTLVVQVQDPRISPALFDLVVVPEHDPTRGKNVLVTKTALHRVNNKKLDLESEKFPELKKMPAPRVAILIGGNSKTHSMTKQAMEHIITKLLDLPETYSLMITVSRRTPSDCMGLLIDRFSDAKNVFLWNGEGKNPYFAFLKLADIILVTEDSVSMTSEAVSTGKPVYILPLPTTGKSNRLNKFHELLQDEGYTHKFPEYEDLKQWKYIPPHDTVTVANKIIDILKKRGKIS